MFKTVFPAGTTRDGLYHRGMMDETPLSDHAEAPPATGNLREFTVSELSNLLKRTVEDAFAYAGERRAVARVAPFERPLLFRSQGRPFGAFGRDLEGQRPPPQGEAGTRGLEVSYYNGRLTTFPGQSKYQLVVEQMELAGLGALMAMLEARKNKLSAEGLFDPGRKKTIPFLPAIVGIVTSPTGAVIRDIMHRLSDRCPRRVLLWPVNVQGEKAAGEIAAAIRGFNALPAGGAIPRPDVLTRRGGGSFEDLLAFSEEAVVRAAAESVIPLISAVGHETDTTLIDFAADRRASTPTAAAEMAVPVLRDCVETLLAAHQRYGRRFEVLGRARPDLVCIAAAALRFKLWPPQDGFVPEFAAPRSALCAGFGVDAAADRERGNPARTRIRDGLRSAIEACLPAPCAARRG